MIAPHKYADPRHVSTTDVRRALLDRVVASSHFSKSERLSGFLTYVCELALSGRMDEINEQKIGEAVFGRPRGYDSAIDGIVRTQASRLRQKLDLYFTGEGSEEPVKIVIPRGGYIPFFEPRSAVEIAAPAPAPIPITWPVTFPGVTPFREEKRFGASAIAWVLVAVLSVALLTISGRNAGFIRTAPAAHEAAHPFWSQMFVAGQPTLIVPADSSLVIWQGLTGRNLSLEEYLKADYRTAIPATATVSEKEGSDLARRRYTSIVDLEVVHLLTRISEENRSSLEVRYARDARPTDMRQGNIILIGAGDANPWVQLFEQKMNFSFSNDRLHHIYSVLNREPQGNEPAKWEFKGTDKQQRVYGVIAYVRNLSGNGNVLILEGTSMAGTESAWDFVYNDSQLLPFLEHIKRADGKIPHFEVVLGSNNINGSAGTNGILAWRTVD
jgi:hypothetical protein